MNGIIGIINSLGMSRLIAMAGVTAALVGFFFFLTVRITTPPMALLFSGLEFEESAEIVTKLEGLGVPFELAGDGRTIMVPEDQVLRLRMSLAQDGLPTGGTMGYEIFDNSDGLGTTSFVQNVNHVRALEGELARTIRALDRVRTARVHLVLPKRELFSREQQTPSASIILKTSGPRMPTEQVLAIQNLVAAAVPGLETTNISIIDQRGRLLARSAEDGGASMTLMAFNERKEAYENRAKKQIEDLISRLVGDGNVRAEVTAEMDFDRVTVSEEIFDPDSQVARSTQSISEQDSSEDREQGSEISVANNLPEAAASETGDVGSSSSSARTEETVNFEISKTVRQEVQEAGRLNRLSVAVLVNGIYSVAADGTQTYEPRSAEELTRITELVKSAVGYNEERGDTVEVANMRFAQPDVPDLAASEPTFMNLTKTDYLRIGEMGALLIVGILVILLVVRPVISRLFNIAQESARQTAQLSGPAARGQLPSPAMAGAGAAVQQLPPGAPPPILQAPDGTAVQPEDPQYAELAARQGVALPPPPQDEIAQMIDLANVEGKVKASAVKKIGDIVDRHPEEAVSVVRNWMYSD